MTCPNCGQVISLKALIDLDQGDFMQVAKDGLLDMPKFWGKPGDNRVIIKECFRDGWVHFKVNGKHRLAYLRGKKT